MSHLLLNILIVMMIVYLLKIFKSLENQSRHPEAKALVKEAKKRNISLLPIKSIYTESGGGISGDLESINGN